MGVPRRKAVCGESFRGVATLGILPEGLAQRS